MMATKNQFWKYTGPYSAPIEGKWITDAIDIEGLAGACIIYEAENREPAFLVINGQRFDAVEIADG